MSYANMQGLLRAAAATAGVTFAFTLLTSLEPASAAILTVGSAQTYKTIQSAVNAAHNGDTINIQSGTYGCASIGKSGLTFQGVGSSMPIVTGGVCGGKGLFTISGSNTTVSNLLFKNAVSTDGNGAGIRMQGTNLTVLNSKFTNNQDGILSDYNTASTLTVKNTGFYHNGACVSGKGCAHAIYAGHIGKLDVEDSTFYNTQSGHAIKSRANNTVVVNNNIQDSPTGTSSYSIDVPNGGAATITGNYIEKGPKSGNSTAAIAMGEEGATNPAGAMLIANNTFQNDLAKTQEFIWNKTGNANLTVSGNVLLGYVTKTLTGPGTIQTSPSSMKMLALASNAAQSSDAAAANFAVTMSNLGAGRAAPVPEPTTLALFGAAIIAFALMLGKRTSSRS